MTNILITLTYFTFLWDLRATQKDSAIIKILSVVNNLDNISNSLPLGQVINFIWFNTSNNHQRANHPMKLPNCDKDSVLR